MNFTSKSRSLVLAGLGYVVSIAFLGWEDLTAIIATMDPFIQSIVWGPLVPFTLAAIAALLAPSRRWSVVVTTLIILLVIVGAYLSIMVGRDEYFVLDFVFALMGEAAVSLVLLILVGIARIVVRRRPAAPHLA